MAIFDARNSTELVNMLSGDQFIFDSEDSANHSSTEYSWLTPGGDDIQAYGSGITRSGGMPTGGTITDIDIDLSNNGFSSPDIEISDINNASLVTITSSGLDFLNTVMAGDDTVYGSAFHDYLKGVAGADEIYGFDGNDTLNGGLGNDILVGGEGTDQVYGGSGNDVLRVGVGDISTTGVETYDGGSNFDTLAFVGGSGIEEHFIQNETIEDIERIRFGAFDFSGAYHRTVYLFDTQFGNGGLASNLAIDGYVPPSSNYTETLHIYTAQSVFDASGFTFVDWGDNGELIVLDGSNASQDITGTSQVDEITGEGGNDIIDGRGGGDTLSGGAGIDTLDYTVNSGGVTVNLSTNTATGGFATGDTISGFENVIGAALFANTLTGDANANSLTGGALADILIGNAGNDTLTGNLGNDTLDGGAGADDMFGGGNDDTFEIRIGDVVSGETIDGGTGHDRIRVFETGTTDFSSAALFNLDEIEFRGNGSNQDKVAVFFAQSFKNAGLESALLDSNGSTGSDDTVLINMGVTSSLDLRGLTFQDWQAGDRIEVIGDGSSETIHGSSQIDEITAATGNDFIQGGAGGDILDGGGGSDTLSYEDSNSAVTVNIGANTASGGHAAGDSITGFENLTGSAHNDTLTGTSAGNILRGLGGADIINSGLGADTVFGGSGNDTINGGGAIDNLLGEGGNDTFIITQGHNIDDIDGGTGTDTLDVSSFTGGYNANLTANTHTYSFGGTQTILSVENISSGSGNDVLTGNNADNVFNGNNGADTIYGGGGNDTIHGNAGGDFLYGEDGKDVIYGDSGADSLFGGANNDVLDGGAGQDTFDGGLGDDLLILNDGDALAGAETFDGGAGIDTFEARGGVGAPVHNMTNDTLLNIERITFGTIAANGDRTISFNASQFGAGGISLSATITGWNASGSTETLRIDMASLTSLDLSGLSFANWGAQGEIVDINGDISSEIITGSNQADHITGSGGADTLNGGGGNDTLNGGTNVDVIDGGAGDDTLIGGDGDDTLIGGAGIDSFDGGAGSDWVDYSGTTANASYNLLTQQFNVGFVENWTSIENVKAGSGNDIITGDANDNILLGGAGNDTISVGLGMDIADGGAGDDRIIFSLPATMLQKEYYGGSGTDTVESSAPFTSAAVFDLGGNVYRSNTGAVWAILDSFENYDGSSGSGDETVIGTAGANSISMGSGDNVIEGGAGGDQIDGGAGLDTASYAGSAAAVEVDLALGTATGGDAAGDMLVNIEHLTGSDFADTLTGDANHNVINGGLGDDIINGGDAGDTLDGGAGFDTINGGAGHDNLVGSLQADIMDGGAGTDVADFSGATNTQKINMVSNVNVGGFAHNDTLLNIENVIGSDTRGDDITGTAGNNVIDGRGADDLLRGFNGDDTLRTAATTMTICSAAMVPTFWMARPASTGRCITG